jgi:preprotein translocase subunit SecE
MKTNRLVITAVVVFAVLFGIFLEHVLAELFNLAPATHQLTNNLFSLPLLPGQSKDFSWATIIGLGVSAAGFGWAYMKPEYKAVAEEIASELRKVTWPTIEETRAATIAVIVASLIAAALLGLFDVFWQFLTDKIQNPTL